MVLTLLRATDALHHLHRFRAPRGMDDSPEERAFSYTRRDTSLKPSFSATRTDAALSSPVLQVGV
jgi:hypothetical protein